MMLLQWKINLAMPTKTAAQKAMCAVVESARLEIRLTVVRLRYNAWLRHAFPLVQTHTLVRCFLNPEAPPVMMATLAL
jgi:hypothetical protein